MKYNHFIKGSPSVSEIGMGTWQLGRGPDWQNLSDKEAITLVKKALDSGINFFDTSPNYGYGTSEERLGSALVDTDRTRIVINTKFGHTDKGKLNFKSKYIRTSLEGSLKRLKTEYVDSLIIHNPPFKFLDGNKNDHYEILERLKEEGKIKAYGASLDTSREMNTFMSTTRCEVIEAFFNIIHQDTRKAFLQAEEKGVSIIVKVPLDSGWLSGKYDERSTFNDIRKRWTRINIKNRGELVREISTIIDQKNDLAHFAISFCLSYDAVTTVIPGSKNINQLVHSIEAANNRISNDLVTKLEKLYNEKIERLRLPW
jgi:aryl-alcohol dehydrogenase-like predicted oxidoreductase